MNMENKQTFLPPVRLTDDDLDVLATIANTDGLTIDDLELDQLEAVIDYQFKK